MVSVLAIGVKFHGFKSGQDDVFLRMIKIHSTPSFGGEVTLETQFNTILQHVKITCKYEQILHKPKFSFLLPIPYACYQMTVVRLPDSSGG
jgi:hypothetical protein